MAAAEGPRTPRVSPPNLLTLGHEKRKIPGKAWHEKSSLLVHFIVSVSTVYYLSVDTPRR